MDEPLKVQELSKDGLTWSFLPVEVDPVKVVEDFRTKLLVHVRPQWNPDRLRSKVFDEGITNKLVGIYEEGKKAEDMVLVRLDGEGTSLFIDREAEIMVMLALNRAGIIPPVYCKVRNGMCYGFAPGRTITENEMSDEQMMKRIARAVARLHSVEIPPSLSNRQPQVWAKCEEWLEKAPSKFTDWEKDEWLVHWTPLTCPHRKVSTLPGVSIVHIRVSIYP